MSPEYPELKRTILVGLGGAGKLILTHLKRLFMDSYNVMPPSIRLLSLDTDSAPETLRSNISEREYSLDAHEFLYMKVDQPQQFIECDKTVNQWFIKPLPIGAITDGAGAVREVGRVAFFYHINEFSRRVDNILTELKDPLLSTKMANAQSELGAATNFKLSGDDTKVYICGSLAGGTGSGTFLDIGIYLRNMLPNSLIHGFFLLNWIYRNKAFAPRIKGNVYAALSELDNIQSIMYGQKDFVPYKIQYGELEIEVKNPPYSLFHIVDGRNEFGENIYHVKDLCEAVSNVIFLSMGSMGDPIKSVEDNLLTHIYVADPKIWNGKFARYSSFGISSLYYPAKELHAIISLQNTVKLCNMAIAEVESTASDRKERLSQQQHLAEDVNRFFGETRLNLQNIPYVADKVCPFQAPITFQVQPYEISDGNFPNLINYKFQNVKEVLDKGLQDSMNQNGKNFIDDTLDIIEGKISDIQNAPHFDNAYLQKWIEEAKYILTQQRDEVITEINKKDEEIRTTQHNADNILNIAKHSRYIPHFGGPRKKRTEEWVREAVRYLTVLKDKQRLEYVKGFYDQILDKLITRTPDTVSRPSDVLNALQDTQKSLLSMLKVEQENLKILKSKPNNVIIGNGIQVVIPGEKAGVSLIDSINVDYVVFKKDSDIHTGEDYFLLYQEDPHKLVSLFVDYCKNALIYIKNMTLHQAMETIGGNRGDVAGYIKEQFNHLFRLSSALWSFNKGKMNKDMTRHYDKIVNFGVYGQEEGRTNYGNVIQDVKDQYKINSDHSYSTTRNPYRIWLLNFAAALPLYLLTDLEQNKKKYEEEISPTYHIDKYFEMNVPDLFPVDDIENKALWVIGMAIVPGIDVIHDEKLTKGHKFTLDAEEVKKINFGDPMIWHHFRDMYEEVISTFNEKADNNLLDILTRLLKERIKELPQSELKKYIEEYIVKVKEKLEDRKFSKLKSARLTYRELKELERFKDPRGYGMDIDRYIAGK